MPEYPDDRSYTREHEWTSGDETVTVGITAYAADALGDVVFVDLPAVGTTVAAGDVCGELESTKSVSDLYAPVGGEVVEVNETVAGDPSVVNTDPYGAGWLFRVRVDGPADLLDAAQYAAHVGAG